MVFLNIAEIYKIQSLWCLLHWEENQFSYQRYREKIFIEMLDNLRNLNDLNFSFYIGAEFIRWQHISQYWIIYGFYLGLNNTKFTSSITSLHTKKILIFFSWTYLFDFLSKRCFWSSKHCWIKKLKYFDTTKYFSPISF